MKTMLAGLATMRRAPRASLPFLVVGAAVAVAIGVGLLPAVPQSITAGAVFPLDVLFDVKRSIGYAHSWVALLAALLLSTVVRSALLVASVYLSETEPPPLGKLWRNAFRTTALAIAVLFPGAALFFIGVAVRYAPFVWLAALLTFVPAFVMARRAAWLGREDLGRAAPAPYLGSFLVNAAILCFAGATLDALADTGKWVAALVPLVLAPVEAAFFFGWRAQASGEAEPERSRVIVGVVAACLIVFGVLVIGDRTAGGDFGNRAIAGEDGTLVLLGGADSTSTSGSLSDFDPRFLGWEESAATLLSYSNGPTYTKLDTRGDLDQVAEIVADQLADLERPVAMFGHSQAALILDRMIASGLELPDTAVVISPPPAAAAELNVPPPNELGEGKPGSDLARGFSWVLDRVGLTPFNVDAGASPANLSDVVPEDDGDVRRMAVWALGDSVWLDVDWRRDHEVNIVSISDHVGAVEDGYSLERSAEFLSGDESGDDEGSWRGALATALRYAFAPWRP